MIYKNIQGLRAIAAMMVVFSHIFWPLVPLRYHWLEPYIGAIGPGGVDLFFVISGFVVSLSAYRLGIEAATIGRWRAFREFVVKRIFRIYPIYWLVFLCASVVLMTTDIYLGAPGMAQRPWFGLFLLIDQPNNRIMAAWTLQFELFFYATCAAAILIFPRNVVLPLAVWLCAVLAVWIASWWGSSLTWKVWLTPLMLEFAFGIAVAVLARRKISGYAVASVGVGFLGLLFGAIVFHLSGGWGMLNPIWRVVCFGIPSGFIVYGFVAIEMRKMWQFSKGWVFFGDASYSLYLWHQLTFAVMTALYWHFGLVGKVPLTALGLFFLVVTIPLSLLTYRYIERPINKSRFVHSLATGEKPKPKPVVVLRWEPHVDFRKDAETVLVPTESPSTAA